MARKKGAKAEVRWITADDELFAGHPEWVARAFLRGYVGSLDEIKFFRPDSPEEAQARKELIHVLWDVSEPLSRTIRILLAQLFAEQANEWPDIFDCHQRRLVFAPRDSKRQSYRARDRLIPMFIAAELHNGGSVKNAITDARQRYGGSRSYILGLWKKYRAETMALLADQTDVEDEE